MTASKRQRHKKKLKKWRHKNFKYKGKKYKVPDKFDGIQSPLKPHGCAYANLPDKWPCSGMTCECCLANKANEEACKMYRRKIKLKNIMKKGDKDESVQVLPREEDR